MPDPPDFFDDIFGRDYDFGDTRRRTRAPHPMPCPSIAILMAYANEHDTSLTPRRRARIREHVHCCEACFSQVERIFGGLLQDVYEMLGHDYDASRAATRRLESRFQQALHAQVKEKAPPLGSPHLLRQQWLAPVAATLAVITIGVLLFRPATAVIHAEQLIERAVSCEREHTAGLRQRVRQTLSSGMFAVGRVRSGTSAAPDMPSVAPFSEVRDVADGAFTAEMRLVNTREREAHGELARLFETHRFDWRKPFCLTCYRAWRTSLSWKRDTVTLTGDLYLLRTTTPEGRLREVTMAIDRRSYRIVRQTFLFEGVGLIAVEELERQAAPVSAPAGQRASAASRAAVDDGIGTLAPPISSRPPAAGDLARGASRAPLSRWLDRNFAPSNTARATFLPEVDRRSSSVRQHLIGLQRLVKVSISEKSEKVKHGTDADRTKLRQQVELEYQGLITHLSALEERLNVLLGTGTRSLESSQSVPADWPRRVSTALPHATRLQHRLRRIFAHDDVPYEETQKSRPRSARAAFEALWESIHGNQRDGDSGPIPN